MRDVRRFGGRVRLELERTDGKGGIEAELSRDQYLADSYARGERVYVRPRNPRVFIDAGCPLQTRRYSILGNITPNETDAIRRR